LPGLALCLTSSFLGHYAHMGLLNRLDAAGVLPERIAASSAGAIAGGIVLCRDPRPGIGGPGAEILVQTGLWRCRVSAALAVRCDRDSWHGISIREQDAPKYLRKRLGDKKDRGPA
jgi:predicted acylesterase/phospholipase RssA